MKPSLPRLTISVLTKNEALNIERCLRSASFANELVVIDGGSTDATVELARACGAEVYVYADWQGFAIQRNRQLMHANGDYLLLLDADEEITPELRHEILALVASAPNSVYGLYALEVAFGRPLKFAALHKAYSRLFRKEFLKGFEGAVHESPTFTEHHAHGGFLRNPINHFSKTDVHMSLKKLTQYASLGAHKRHHSGKRGGVVRGIFAGAAAFITTYLFKRAFTGGAEGFLYSLFIALEAFFRYAALRYDDAASAGRVGR